MIQSWKRGGTMNDRIQGIIYIVLAILLVVVNYTFAQFWEILLWVIVIVLFIGGLLLFFKKT